MSNNSSNYSSVNTEHDLSKLIEECKDLIREEAEWDGNVADFEQVFYAHKLAYMVKERIADAFARLGRGTII